MNIVFRRTASAVSRPAFALRRSAVRPAIHRPALFAAFALAACAAAAAQSSVDTPVSRQLAKIDIALSGAGQFTSNTNGTTGPNQTVTLSPSNTVGVLFTARYVAKPLIGLEFNYTYARYSENFNFTNIAPNSSGTTFLDAQTNVSEYTFGYLVHTPKEYFGVQPFASVGAGSLAFRPTKNGGEGFTPQARAAYYYSIGAEQLIYGQHVGARLAFRQVFALAPDFETTYLRDHQHAVTSEPTLGFFLRF